MDVDQPYQSKGRRLVELMDELRVMPERRAINELQLLRASVYVFRRNYAELVDFLDFCETDPVNQDLWHMTTMRKQEGIANETARLLHNFVASAMSLRDLTILMHHRLHRDGSFPEYRSEAELRFKNDQVVQFVQKLRHFIMHIDTPPITFHADIDIGTGHADIKLGLLTSELLEWDEWKSVAKSYLTGAGESVHIRSVVAQYEEKIRSFYIWYGDKEQDFQQEAVDRFRAKQNEYFLLHIEDALDKYASFPDSDQVVGDRGLFLGLFDLAEFEELERLPAPSPERIETALRLLRDHLPITPQLEDKIRAAYSDSRFFRGRSKNPEET